MADTPAAGKGEALEVFWGKIDHLEPIFADNLHVQRVNDQFYLTFGQIRLPIVEGPSNHVVAEIHPVARVILTKESLQRVLELLNRTLSAGSQS